VRPLGFQSAPAPIVNSRRAARGCESYGARVRVHTGTPLRGFSPAGEAGGSPCCLRRRFPCQGTLAARVLAALRAAPAARCALRALPLTLRRLRQGRCPSES
jgi:hypothetical protein